MRLHIISILILLAFSLSAMAQYKPGNGPLPADDIQRIEMHESFLVNQLRIRKERCGNADAKLDNLVEIYIHLTLSQKDKECSLLEKAYSPIISCLFYGAGAIPLRYSTVLGLNDLLMEGSKLEEYLVIAYDVSKKQAQAIRNFYEQIPNHSPHDEKNY